MIAANSGEEFMDIDKTISESRHLTNR